MEEEKKKVLLIEPDYNNKFPPVGLMRLATYYRNLGNWKVVFYKGDLKLFVNEVANAIHGYMINPNGVFIQPMLYVNNYDVISVVLGTIIIEIFNRIRIPHNKLINFLGSCTFMVYLLHGNLFWIYISRGCDWIKMLYESPILYCLKLFKWTGITLVVGIIGYIMFLLFGRICSNCKKIVIKRDDS